MLDLPLPLCFRTGYIGDMINILEKKGIMPIPIFISGVEGHTVVRGKYVHLYMCCTCVSCVSYDEGLLYVQEMIDTFNYRVARLSQIILDHSR